MRTLSLIALALALVSFTSAAQADTVTGLALTMEADDVVLTVDADDALRAPRVHLDAGAVRMWFPGLPQQALFIERRGDGRAVRRVTARPGASNTALVSLDLGDGRRLTPTDVRIALDGTRATVRIARSALPPAIVTTVVPHAAQYEAAAAPIVQTPIALPAAQPAAQLPSATPVAQLPTATPVAQPAAQPPAAATTATPVAAAAPSTVPAASATTTSATPRATTPFVAPRPPQSAASFAGAIPDAKNAGMRTVGLVVALLVGLALFGRWLKQKRASRPAAAISVVASHRLGAKHQLVVVRAFDQEILLSVNGGETRRIASRRAGEEAETMPMNEPSITPEPRVSGASRLLALVPAAKPSMDRPASAHPAPRAAAVDEPTSPFGAELARLMRGVAQAPATRPAVSDSVSGLVRLRESKAQR